MAITHFDYNHPEQVGLIAAMKPKAGLGDFGTFLAKLKAAYPDQIKQGRSGSGSVAGVDYEWIQGPGAADKICVAQIKGWIVTSWGEAPLQDWIERFHKMATTSSLAEDVDYRTSVSRVGENPTTLVYVNYHALVGILQKSMAATNPVTGDYLAKKFDALGGGAIATRFENGEIVDRFSLLVPRPVQLDAGVAADPCTYDTLKFTGPDTHLYWASNINWKAYFSNIKGQTGTNGAEAVNPMASSLYTYVQNWIHLVNLDAKKNIIDALGQEFSVQVDWSQDTTWPEVGLFVKLDKPSDFKPTIDAIIESVRKNYLQTATIKELNANGHNFAALKFIDPGIFTPTITEDGDYLGVFLTENQAVRAFSRDPSLGLTHNTNFNRQIGDLRNGSAQMIFVDSPYILDRAYKTALPFMSMAIMANKDVAGMLKDKEMPADLSWLAPVGTWSCVITPDGAGIQATSVSGIGNQGILLGGAAYQATGLLQSMGYLPKPAATPTPGATIPAEAGVAAPATPPTTSAAPVATPPPAAATNADAMPAIPPASSTNATSDVLAPPADTNAPAAAH